MNEVVMMVSRNTDPARMPMAAANCEACVINFSKTGKQPFVKMILVATCSGVAVIS